MKGRAALAAALLLSCAGCVVYSRRQHDEPLPPEAVAGLAPGAGLADCLQRLGAPARVFPHRGDGAALLWAWSDHDGWSIDVSVPLQDQLSASFDVDLDDTESRGCMLWFDGDLRLERWRSGRLGDLLRQRARPAAEPEDAGPGGG